MTFQQIQKKLYVYKYCLKMIEVNKILTFYVPKNIFGNVIIGSVKKPNVLEE